MTETLLTSKQVAERLGVSFQNLAKAIRPYGLTHVAKRGRFHLFAPADVERVAQERATIKQGRPPKKAATTTAKRTRTRKTDVTRTPKADATEKANAKMLANLDPGPGSNLPNLDADMTPTGSESAVVWAAFLSDSLAPGSRWYGRTPPASYERAYLARETARADARHDLELAAA